MIYIAHEAHEIAVNWSISDWTYLRYLVDDLESIHGHQGGDNVDNFYPDRGRFPELGWK